MLVPYNIKVKWLAVLVAYPRLYASRPNVGKALKPQSLAAEKNHWKTSHKMVPPSDLNSTRTCCL